MERTLQGEARALKDIAKLSYDEVYAKAMDLEEFKRHTEIPRQKEEADRILGHYVFEMVYRQGLVKDLETAYEMDAYEA